MEKEKRMVRCRICGEWFDEQEQIERDGNPNGGCCSNCSPYPDDYEPAEGEEE